MPLARVTRRYRFAASHRLHSPLLPEEENRAVYGKCNNPYGHGHDYVLEVSVAGPVDARTGRVVSLPQLDRLVREAVVARLDRRNLNTEVEEFAALAPTTEHLAAVAARRLARAWRESFPTHPARLQKVRIHETGNNIVEVNAPAAEEEEETPDAARRHAGR
jgi:6-pyruvoyltetrahydropterin/6-carboxytetrahydropterin synthase